MDLISIPVREGKSTLFYESVSLHLEWPSSRSQMTTNAGVDVEITKLYSLSV